MSDVRSINVNIAANNICNQMRDWSIEIYVINVLRAYDSISITDWINTIGQPVIQSMTSPLTAHLSGDDIVKLFDLIYKEMKFV